jgi:hypothetical protein
MLLGGRGREGENVMKSKRTKIGKIFAAEIMMMMMITV